MANTILDEYAQDFSDLAPRDQLTMLIEIGDELAEIPAEDKTEANEIHGCQSAAYLTATLNDNTITFQGWADARSVRGYMAILCEAMSDQLIEYILGQGRADLDAFLNTTKLAEDLTPNRANSIATIFQAMQERAKAFKG